MPSRRTLPVSLDMNKLNSLAVFFLTILVSCNNQPDSRTVANYKDGKQIPILDSSSSVLSYNAPDTVVGGQEYCAKIWLTNKSQDIVESYAQCDFNSSLVDTAKNKLDNCRFRLLVKHDTTHFCLEALDSNLSQSFRLAVLTKDVNKVYHLNQIRLKFRSTKKPTGNSK